MNAAATGGTALQADGGAPRPLPLIAAGAAATGGAESVGGCRLVRCRERIPSFGRHRLPLFRSYFGIAFVLDAEQPDQNLCQAGARRRE